MAQPDPTDKPSLNDPDLRVRVVVPDTTSTVDVGLPDSESLTYEPYFGLHDKPFSLSPDPRFFFKNATRRATFDALVAGIRRREGILTLTGETGTGKTTLCRTVLQALDRKTFAAFVPDPFLSREDLLKILLVDFGVISVDEIRSGRLQSATRTDLSYLLYEFLTSLHPLQAFAVVMIDESQNLPPQLLEEIRILADMEVRQKLLQVLFIGQPQLEAHLGTPEMRQLNQRVSVRCELLPLSRQDVAPYISHRLAVAGNSGTLQFSDPAIELVFRASSGIPRLINVVCDRALHHTARGRRMVVKDVDIFAATEDLRLPMARNLQPLLWVNPNTELQIAEPQHKANDERIPLLPPLGISHDVSEPSEWAPAPLVTSQTILPDGLSQQPFRVKNLWSYLLAVVITLLVVVTVVAAYYLVTTGSL